MFGLVVAMTYSIPGLAKRLVLVLPWLKPEGNPFIPFTAVGKFPHLRREQHLRRWSCGYPVQNNPEIAHDLVERGSQWHWISLAQGLYLYANESRSILAVSNDIDASSVSGGRHHVPPKTRKPVATVVEPDVAGKLRVKSQTL